MITKAATRTPSATPASNVTTIAPEHFLMATDNLAVPQDSHCDSRTDVKRGHQESAGLAGTETVNPGCPGGDDATVEAAAEVARFDRRTVPCGEDQAGIYPAVPHSHGQRPAACGP